MSIRLRGWKTRGSVAGSEDEDALGGAVATPLRARPYVVAASEIVGSPWVTRVAQQEYVLVVESDASLRYSLEGSIARAGYRVEAVANGAAALQRVVMGRPQLVITGDQMRDLSCIHLIRTIRAQRGCAGIPVILSMDLTQTKGLSKRLEHVPGIVHVIDRRNTAELLRTTSSVVPTASFPGALRAGGGG